MTTELAPKPDSILRTTLRWLPIVALGSLFVMQGVIKLSPDSPFKAMFERFGYPAHFYQVIGVVELLAGLALFVPRWSGYAALTLGAVMMGASATHVTQGEWPSMGFTAALAVIFLLLARARFRKA